MSNSNFWGFFYYCLDSNPDRKHLLLLERPAELQIKSGEY